MAGCLEYGNELSGSIKGRELVKSAIEILLHTHLILNLILRRHQRNVGSLVGDFDVG
jgi:hypothetical protein